MTGARAACAIADIVTSEGRVAPAASRMIGVVITRSAGVVPPETLENLRPLQHVPASEMNVSWGCVRWTSATSDRKAVPLAELSVPTKTRRTIGRARIASSTTWSRV